MNDLPAQAHLRVEIIMEFQGKRISKKDFEENPLIQSSLPNLIQFQKKYHEALNKASRSHSYFRMVVSENGIDITEVK
ncbi:hypothetical protein [Fluviicola sp.]|uniref:hypothetical protein n=1 Tax=Fluviicola sp. TaxID=1917219 RepID=UPI0031E05213